LTKLSEVSVFRGKMKIFSTIIIILGLSLVHADNLLANGKGEKIKVLDLKVN
jgi:hypothetical protein